MILLDLFHNMICLYDSWTNKSSKIDLDGYSKPFHSFRKFQHKRAKRASGGIIIYVKDELRHGIKLIKNDTDALIWLKLEKSFFNTLNDRYILAVYIPPEHSPVYNILDIDLFSKMETEISFYQKLGEVYLIGDLNSRTGRKPDYIVDDSQLSDFDDDFSPDTPIRRHSEDNLCNRFGD